MFRFIFIIGICLLFVSGCSFSPKLAQNNITTSIKDKPVIESNYNNYLIDKINYDNNNIKLLTPDEVLNLLGNPTLINKINNIEIWQYRKNFILNIVWNNKPSTYINLVEQPLSLISDLPSDKSNSSILWLECIGQDKNKLESNYCFLQLINMNYKKNTTNTPNIISYNINTLANKN